MNDRLQTSLRQLCLSGLAESLDIRLQEAASHELSLAEFLELVLQDELLVRNQRQIDRRVKTATFREVKPLDDFDWSFNPSIPKGRSSIWRPAASRARLATCCSSVRQAPANRSSRRRSVTWRFKQGLVVLYRSIFDVVRDFLHDELLVDQEKLVARYLKPDLLIIDDMSMKHLPRKGGEVLFEIIMRRHETRSTMMTSNRPLEDWGKLIGDVPSATAILDRFLAHAEVISMTGKGYRLRNQKAPLDTAPDDAKPANAPTGSAAKKESKSTDDSTVATCES